MRRAEMNIDEQINILKDYNLSILGALNNLSEPICDYGINFLTFRRIYNDGRLVHFANDKKWLIYSVENQCQTSLDLISDIKIDEQFAHVWMSDSLLLSEEVQKAMYENNLCNGLTLYDKRENYVDLWAFATDKHNNTALDLYINKLTIIKRFVLYLQDKANYIFFPKHMDLCIDTGNKLDFSSFDDTAESLMGIDLFGISKFYIDAEKKQYLTKRELLCLLCLSKGLSFKEASNILNVSPRTVESHINSIKLKTGANFKNDILDKCKYLINMYN